MYQKFLFIIFFYFALGSDVFSQHPDALMHKLDSLNERSDTAGGQLNNIAPTAYNENTRISFKNYFVLLASDVKQSFTKPFHMSKKDWGNLGKFTLATVALSFADEPIQEEVVRLRNHNPALNDISNYISDFGGVYEAYTLATLGAYGFIL